MIKTLLSFDDFLERVSFHVRALKGNNVKRTSTNEWVSTNADNGSRVIIFQNAMGTNKRDIGLLRKNRQGISVTIGSQSPVFFRMEDDAQEVARELLKWFNSKECLV